MVVPCYMHFNPPLVLYEGGFKSTSRPWQPRPSCIGTAKDLLDDRSWAPSLILAYEEQHDGITQRVLACPVPIMLCDSAPYTKAQMAIQAWCAVEDIADVTHHSIACRALLCVTRQSSYAASLDYEHHGVGMHSGKVLHKLVQPTVMAAHADGQA